MALKFVETLPVGASALREDDDLRPMMMTIMVTIMMMTMMVMIVMTMLVRKMMAMTMTMMTMMVMKMMVMSMMGMTMMAMTMMMMTMMVMRMIMMTMMTCGQASEEQTRSLIAAAAFCRLPASLGKTFTKSGSLNISLFRGDMIIYLP